jgi:tRNA (guanosine-2'-O-)-methyltransferase
MDQSISCFVVSVQCHWTRPFPILRHYVRSTPSTRWRVRASQDCATAISAADRARILVERGTLRPADENVFASLTDSRAARLQKVVENRLRRFCFCLDGVHGAHNLAAIVRSSDAWGIQALHLISNQRSISSADMAAYIAGDAEVDDRRGRSRPRFHFRGDDVSELFNQKSVKNVSKSAHKWLKIVEHSTAPEAVSALRDEGYRICVSSLSPEARCLSEIDISVNTAFVFGSEKGGVSAAVQEAADEFFTIPMYGFVESINVSVAAAVVANHVSERARSACTSEHRDRLFHSPSEQAEMYHSLLLTSQVRNRKTGRNLTSRFDVTKLGSALERSIAKNGMFDQGESSDTVIRALQLSNDGGMMMKRVFLKRARIGAFGHLGGADGYVKRCRCVDLAVIGFGALSCEAALFLGSRLKDGLRHKLVHYFEGLAAAINAEYAAYFDAGGFPRMLNSSGRKEGMYGLRAKCWEHAWNIVVQFGEEQLHCSEPELVELLERVTTVDVARCIASSARCNDEVAASLVNVAAEGDVLFPMLNSILSRRDKSRDMFVNMSLFPALSDVLSCPASLTLEEIDILQIIIRFGHLSDVVSGIHHFMWERESAWVAGRSLSARDSLLECSLVDGIAEMKKLGYDDKLCVSRGLYEWMCAVSAFKSHLQHLGLLRVPKRLEAPLGQQ